jgi:hypothetical protein
VLDDIWLLFVDDIRLSSLERLLLESGAMLLAGWPAWKVFLAAAGRETQASQSSLDETRLSGT